MTSVRAGYGAAPAAGTGPFVTNADTLGGLVLAGRLSVPLNQRPWEWRSANLDDLFLDLVATADRWSVRRPDQTWATLEGDRDDVLPHFFGPVVLEPGNGAEPRAVVDGQQRLTAATVLVAVMRDVVLPLERTGPVEQRAQARGLSTALNSWLLADPAGGREGVRLRLDDTVAGFFADYVVQASGAEEREEVRIRYPDGVDADAVDVRRALAIAVVHLTDRLRAHLAETGAADRPDRLLSRVRCMFDTLRDRFVVVVIEVLSPGMVPQLFAGLNARGTALNEADKIKNELFLVSPTREHAAVKGQWDEMVRAAPDRDAQGFLRLRHVAFCGDTPQRGLHANVRERELSGASGLPAVRQWARDARLMRVVDARELHDAVGEDTLRHLKDVRLLRHTYARPLLLAAAQAFLDTAPDDFAEAVLLARNVSFRELTMKRTQPELFLTRTGAVARDLAQGLTPAELAARLLAISPDDDFRRRFSVYHEPRTDAAYLILYNLELAAGGGGGLVPPPYSSNPRDRRNSIEHILPRHLSAERSDEFAAWRDPADPSTTNEAFRQYVQRVGNLLLLEGAVNSDMNDHAFRAKQTGEYPSPFDRVRKGGRERLRLSYRNSQLALPRRLADTARWGPEWTADSIDSWQEELAVLAVQAFRLRPAARRRAARGTGRSQP